MSDKKKTEISVMPEFVSGEQPTAAKFNAIGSLIKRESFVLEKAIGDIWGESEPYTIYSSSLLSIPLFQSSIKNIINSASDVNGRSLDIASLGRAIGPMSKLNPKILTDGLNHTYGDLSSITETITGNPGCQYSFRYMPATSSTFVFSDTTVFNTQKSIEDLKDAGDYAIDQSKGIIYTVSEIVSGSTISYSVRPSEWSGGPSYSGSSFNTIPDINQVGIDDLVISQPIGGIYEINFPVITIQTTNYDESSVSLGDADVNNLGQYKLPASIIAVCGGDYQGASGVVDSIIPEGMIYLRNANTGEIYSDGVYYYNNDSSIKVENVTLDLNDSYYLITVGTDITSSIEDLGKKQFKHKHSREFGEPLVSVKDLDDIHKEKPESGNYFPSTIPGNHFSQYLHRDGHRSTEASLANDDNAMRGNLLIGRETEPGVGWVTEAGNYVGPGDTFKLQFGERNLDYINKTEGLNTADSPAHWLNIKAGEEDSGVYITAKDRVWMKSWYKKIDIKATDETNGEIYLESGIYTEVKSDEKITLTAPYTESTEGMRLGLEQYPDVSQLILSNEPPIYYMDKTIDYNWNNSQMKCTTIELKDHWMAGYQANGNPFTNNTTQDFVYVQTAIPLPWCLKREVVINPSSDARDLKIYNVSVIASPRGYIHPNDDTQDVMGTFNNFPGLNETSFGFWNDNGHKTPYDHGVGNRPGTVDRRFWCGTAAGGEAYAAAEGALAALVLALAAVPVTSVVGLVLGFLFNILGGIDLRDRVVGNGIWWAVKGIEGGGLPILFVGIGEGWIQDEQVENESNRPQQFSDEEGNHKGINVDLRIMVWYKEYE